MYSTSQGFRQGLTVNRKDFSSNINIKANDKKRKIVKADTLENVY